MRGGGYHDSQSREVEEEEEGLLYQEPSGYQSG